MVTALEGNKVVQVGQVAAVPMAGQLLTDFVGEITQVEHPRRGNTWRVHQSGIGHGTKGVPSQIKNLTKLMSQKKGKELTMR